MGIVSIHKPERVGVGVATGLLAGALFASGCKDHVLEKEVVPPFNGGAHVQNILNELPPVQKQLYFVSGGTLQEVHRSMAQNSPNSHNAFTSNYISWHYAYRTNSDAIVTTKEGVPRAWITNATTITLPFLSTLQALSPAEQKEWVRFLNAVVDHEKEHFQIAERTASSLRLFILNHTNAPLTIARLNEVGKQAVDEMSRAHASFDKETDHGRKAGAILNTNAARF